MATSGPSTDVMREYLIALGFRVDETQGRKFENGLARWDKRATALGKALGGAAVAATAMVANFSYQMERLYYASRRADSAAGNIQALDFASRQVGVKGITQNVEALARNLRSNPGLTGLLESLGVPVRGRDKSDVLMGLVTQLKKMPFFVAEKYANLLGIDADTLFMLQDQLDVWKKANEQRKQWAAEFGVDTDAAAAAGKEMAQQWREVTEKAGLFRDALVIAILPALKKLAAATGELLRDWSQRIKLQPQQGSLLDRIGEGLGIKQVGGGVTLTKEAQERLGQSEADQDTYTVTDPDGTKRTVRKRWLDRQYDKFMEWAGAKKYQRKAADQATVDAVQDVPRDRPGAPRTQAEIDAAVRSRLASGQGVNTGGYAAPQGAALASGGRPASTGSRSNDAMSYFMSKGWTREQAAGIVANLSKESSFNHQAVGDGGRAYGIAQWHPDRQADFKRWAGKDIRDSSYEEQLAFVQWELENKSYLGGDALKRARSAREAGAVVSNQYERPKLDESLERGLSAERYAAGYQPAAAGTTVNQTNNVTVNGTSDPAAAGREVESGINRANSDLVRNQRPKVQ